MRLTSLSCACVSSLTFRVVAQDKEVEVPRDGEHVSEIPAFIHDLRQAE